MKILRHMVNATAYHPQIDGLAERFNRALTDMLAKKVEQGRRDWDAHLPFVLFAYRASLQESTKESVYLIGQSNWIISFPLTARIPTLHPHAIILSMLLIRNCFI